MTPVIPSKSFRNTFMAKFMSLTLAFVSVVAAAAPAAGFRAAATESALSEPAQPPAGPKI